MSEDSLGKIFKVQSFGESHGEAIGVTIEGCPPLVDINTDEIQEELNRRKPGQSSLTTPRKEKDLIRVISGIYENKSLGSPICMIIYNEDSKGKDYSDIVSLFRPSHADFTYESKYGLRFPQGGGRSSARITAGWVAAGAIAKKILKQNLSIEILAYTKQIKDIKTNLNPMNISKKDIEASIVRCPDKNNTEKMKNLILETKKNGDSLGGIIECVIKNPPVGLGEPVFGKLEGDLAKACMCIPASKGFEIGSGFDSVYYYGSELNDEFQIKNSKVITKSNNSGGIQGGISNGMPIIFRVAFKPTSTIFKEQNTINNKKESSTIKPKGRHDPCVLPRAVPIVEAVASIVLCDHFIRHKTI